MNIFLVFLGGGIGSALRFGTSLLVQKHFSTSFPAGTLISNFTASALLAVVMLMVREERESVRLFLVTGICGGFSTFSAFSYETVFLFRQGNNFMAIANILISLSLCMIAVWLIVKSKS